MDRSHNVSNECARVRSGELAPETGPLALRPRVLNPDPVLTTRDKRGQHTVGMRRQVALKITGNV